jgi:hypothetical protein
VCEVEVDPETGVVEVVRYTTVDDCGRAVNPMILHGQTHGGIAQGVGQALWESCAYDPETGQLLSATLMDYALPRADMLPSFTTEISEVPSTSHPLGLRGGGEGGTTPALGAVVNAICRCAGRFRCRAHRAAGNARAGLAGDSATRVVTPRPRVRRGHPREGPPAPEGHWHQALPRLSACGRFSS